MENCTNRISFQLSEPSKFSLPCFPKTQRMARSEESDGGQRHSSGDQLGKRTKSLDQQIKELDLLMKDPLIDGFTDKDIQGIKEDYNQIKQEVQDF